MPSFWYSPGFFGIIISLVIITSLLLKVGGFPASCFVSLQPAANSNGNNSEEISNPFMAAFIFPFI